MAAYLDILATQGPTSIGNDANGQPMLSFNVRASGSDATVNSAWESDLAAIIHSAGFGTLYTDMFIGSAADIPIGVTVVEIINTGGAMTTFAPVSGGEDYQLHKLSAQIIVRGKGYFDANTRAQAIYALLNGKRNITV